MNWWRMGIGRWWGWRFSTFWWPHKIQIDWVALSWFHVFNHNLFLWGGWVLWEHRNNWDVFESFLKHLDPCNWPQSQLHSFYTGTLFTWSNCPLLGLCLHQANFPFLLPALTTFFSTHFFRGSHSISSPCTLTLSSFTSFMDPLLITLLRESTAAMAHSWALYFYFYFFKL